MILVQRPNAKPGTDGSAWARSLWQWPCRRLQSYRVGSSAGHSSLRIS